MKRLRERHPWFMSAGVSLLILATLGGWAAEMSPASALTDDTKTTRTASVATSALTAPTDLRLTPVATFAAKCVRCHGPEGAKYKPSVWMRNCANLRKQLTTMMTRRAKLEPTPAEVEAMAAYVRSLKGGVFVEIANGAEFAAGKSAKLAGEATPGARVTLVKDGKETPLTLTKGAWATEGAPQPPFVIRAAQGNLTAEIAFPKMQWASVANPEQLKLAAEAAAKNPANGKSERRPERPDREERSGER